VGDILARNLSIFRRDFGGMMVSAYVNFAGEVTVVPLGAISGVTTYHALPLAKEGRAIETSSEVFA
jgi:hypothetical protein